MNRITSRRVSILAGGGRGAIDCARERAAISRVGAINCAPTTTSVFPPEGRRTFPQGFAKVRRR